MHRVSVLFSLRFQLYGGELRLRTSWDDIEEEGV